MKVSKLEVMIEMRNHFDIEIHHCKIYSRNLNEFWRENSNRDKYNFQVIF